MTQKEIQENIDTLKELIASPDVPADEKDGYKETLELLEKKLKEPESKPASSASKPAKKTAAKKVKEPKARKQAPMKKESITYKGKEYTLEDCNKLFNAFKDKIKSQKKSSEKSADRSTAEKIIDKAQTTIKQLLKDKAAQKKIKDNPKEAKRELATIENKFRNLIESIEKFLGKKMSQKQVDGIFDVIHKRKLSKGGSAGEEAEWEQSVIRYLNSEYPDYKDSKLSDADDEEYNDLFFEMVDDLRKKWPGGYLGNENEVWANHMVEKYMSSLGFGGRIKSALMRDRKYKSNEPHEKAYKRKNSPKNKRYKK